MINEVTLRNIYNDLVELSDISMQKKYWLKYQPERVSSFTELMCRLFDDYDIERFVNLEIQQFDLNPNFMRKIVNLVELLNNYDEKGLSDIDIIEDKEWNIISEFAKEVVIEWKCNILPA